MRLRHGKPIEVPLGASLSISCINVRGPFPTFTLKYEGGGGRRGAQVEVEFFNFSETQIARYGHDSLAKAIRNGLDDAVGVLKITSWEGKPFFVELVHTYFQYEREPMRPPIHDYFRKAKK